MKIIDTLLVNGYHITLGKGQSYYIIQIRHHVKAFGVGGGLIRHQRIPTYADEKKIWNNAVNDLANGDDPKKISLA